MAVCPSLRYRHRPCTASALPTQAPRNDKFYVDGVSNMPGKPVLMGLSSHSSRQRRSRVDQRSKRRIHHLFIEGRSAASGSTCHDATLDPPNNQPLAIVVAFKTQLPLWQILGECLLECFAAMIQMPRKLRMLFAIVGNGGKIGPVKRWEQMVSPGVG